MNTSKPKLKLVGQNGNAFAILGCARKAAKQAKWTPEKVAEYTQKATSGDYNNLLAVTMEYFFVEDDEDEDN